MSYYQEALTELTFVVAEASIEVRLSILDTRVSFFQASCFDTSIATVGLHLEQAS
jgi:hypothetical protein